ncbi:MAG: RHS repeat-associated core domain-containing protein, partial [Candidatus Kentron sp. G]
ELLSQAQDSSLTHSTLQLRATMSAIRHPCLIVGRCPSNFEGRNTQGTTTVANYLYNAEGQRVAKTVDGQTTHFVYDPDGRLLGVYDAATGGAMEEIVYLGSEPVATVRDGSVFHIHTDHLGTPRSISNQSGVAVWRWDSDPFGEALPDEDPDGDGSGFVFHLRFPGQYFDGESGKYYNYFRDYDPKIGGYITTDPTGLAAGLNLYAGQPNEGISRFT